MQCTCAVTLSSALLRRNFKTLLTLKTRLIICYMQKTKPKLLDVFLKGLVLTINWNISCFFLYLASLKLNKNCYILLFFRDAIRKNYSEDILLDLIGSAVRRKKKQHAGMFKCLMSTFENYYKFILVLYFTLLSMVDNYKYEEYSICIQKKGAQS